MSISSVTDTTSSAATHPTLLPGAQRIPQKSLGESDFLKLLTVQMSSQDPLNPSTDTQSIAQMASFSSLQAMSDLSKAFQTFSTQQSFFSAQSLLGKNVSINDGSTSGISGVVSSVDNSSGKPLLAVNGSYYPVTSVTQVNTTTPSTGGSTKTGN